MIRRTIFGITNSSQCAVQSYGGCGGDIGRGGDGGDGDGYGCGGDGGVGDGDGYCGDDGDGVGHGDGDSVVI